MFHFYIGIFIYYSSVFFINKGYITGLLRGIIKYQNFLNKRSSTKQLLSITINMIPIVMLYNQKEPFKTQDLNEDLYFVC